MSVLASLWHSHTYWLQNTALLASQRSSESEPPFRPASGTREPLTTPLYSTIQDTVLPVTEPIRMSDGTLSDAILIPKGTRIVANILASNRDPALWGPDANKWRPSRWLEPLPREVEEAHVPGVYSNMSASHFLCVRGVSLDAPDASNAG